MMRLKNLLNLRDPFGAMIWAFVCVAWQGGRRSGELVRKRTGACNPQFDMHRGRVTWDWKEDGTCARGRIALGPDKTDPTGEQGHTCFMPFSASAEINAAAAVAHMLALDPTPPAENATTPLFRDTRGGWVWTWNVTARQNVRRITKIPFLVCTCPLHSGQRRQADYLRCHAGPYEAVATNVRYDSRGRGVCHSFRRGTATGLAQINAPSYVVKGIGIWGSGAYLGYVDATEPGAMEQAMLAVAESEPSGVLGPRGTTQAPKRRILKKM